MKKKHKIYTPKTTLGVFEPTRIDMAKFQSFDILASSQKEKKSKKNN